MENDKLVRLSDVFAAATTSHGELLERISNIPMVEESPTIDAVPVVRCRECSKWDKAFELDNGQVFGACERFYGAETEDSFFCRDGQRREDGDA
jgi:hypothetical protein